ncbi:MAG: bifunctional hydroxymethylpyrimidine kinase/phosphomethylpyrimidine kinase [Acidilobaceae archaeon]|nr:bifunctional hydroxymethylpyrimidine kinase/phosphomethylpyrimidine kinase [Acidilobaceae archaeon]MCX8165751.1 bifunctional hydroxymethylpyrimidine kinase/phosphomethylpyrimidine kinase [Acidilobaceae archaeon]MDW7974176.1 bifunctional hydroxymethylpyrimidine kinase/phosphomethylpyrimidine kinase [Sulfolobales archaeon]
MKKPLPVALTIAGSDSGGGAGIQADLKTFAVMGVHGTSAITSITAQNTKEVRAIHDLPPEMVIAQVEAIADDLGVDAAKTGMLSNAEIIVAVAKVVDKYSFPLVVDPVMIAKSGAPLLRPEAMEALIKEIVPRATVITPNRFEAERLTGMKIDSLKAAREAAKIIVEELGSSAAVVKGGHIVQDPSPESVDVLYFKGEYYEFKAPRIYKKTDHGTGCAFSAAIAAGLAKGRSVVEAVSVAKEFITMAIDYGLEMGGGHGPVNPVSWLEVPAERYRVLQEVERGVEILVENAKDVVGLIPEVSTNIVMALPKLYARTPLDVAGVPGRIGRFGERLVVPAKPEFGASRHLARAVLAAMDIDPEVRAAMNIRYGKDIEEAVTRLGFSWSYYDRREEPEEVKRKEGATMAWGIREAARRVGKMPEIVFDYGEHGKEPITKIFGKTAREVAQMAVAIGRELRKG